MLKLVLAGDPLLDHPDVSIIAIVEPVNDPSKLGFETKALLPTQTERSQEEGEEDIFLALIDSSADPSLLVGTSKEVNLASGQGHFVMFPYPNKSPGDRFSVYCAGPTNCGKSTIIAKTAEIWGLLKRNKKKRVIMFCRMGGGDKSDEDPAFQFIRPKPIYVPLDDSIFEMSMPDLRDSLVIFDDVDVIANKKIREHVLAIRSDCLQNGRKLYIDMMNSSHLVLDFNKTKQSITEATVCVVFPNSGCQIQIERLLKNYLGLSKEQIQKIKNITRWVAFTTISPRVAIHSTGAFVL
jgi:hypothetical protein